MQKLTTLPKRESICALIALPIRPPRPPPKKQSAEKRVLTYARKVESHTVAPRASPVFANIFSGRSLRKREREAKAISTIRTKLARPKLSLISSPPRKEPVLLAPFRMSPTRAASSVQWKI